MSNLSDLLLYAATSANIYNFLDRDDYDHHFQFYKDVIEVGKKAHSDLVEFRGNQLSIIDPYKVLEQEEGTRPIFITFHAGSYNMLISHFLTQGFEITVLADNESVTNRDYIDYSAKYREKFNNNANCEMLNVQGDGAIFRILKNVKSHKPTLAFIDGNKGVDGLVKDNENMLDVDFLKGSVKVRKGLPVIAHLLDVPIVLTLAHHEEGQDFLTVYEPIHKFKNETREEYCKRSINQLFAHFEEYINKYSNQWGGWPYIHYWTDLSKFQNDQPSIESTGGQDFENLTFNTDRFIPLKFRDEHILFDKRMYKAIRIDGENVQLFSSRTDCNKRANLIKELASKNPELVKDFVGQGVLVQNMVA